MSDEMVSDPTEQRDPSGPAAATRDELAARALAHYREVSAAACHYAVRRLGWTAFNSSSTVEAAIEFWRTRGASEGWEAYPSGLMDEVRDWLAYTAGTITARMRHAIAADDAEAVRAADEDYTALRLIRARLNPEKGGTE